MSNFFVSSLPYASFLKYSKKVQRTCDVTYAIKNHGAYQGKPIIAGVIASIPQFVDSFTFLKDHLNAERTLVPMPRSSPLVTGSLWPTKVICDFLNTNQLGKDVVPFVVRKYAVQQSSKSGNNRPHPQVHYDSFEIKQIDLFSSCTKITIIDDVITRGSTMLAAHKRLTEAFPHADIKCFSLIRYEGELTEIPNMIDPHLGTVENKNDKWLERK